MILFLGLLLATVACILFGHYWEEKHTFSMSPIGTISEVIGFFLAVAVVVMAIIISVNHFTAQESYSTRMAEYEGLTYIVENIDEDYLDEFDIRKAEVVNKILEWNIEVVRNRELCDNRLVGVFYPDYWKDIPTIDYSLLRGD